MAGVAKIVIEVDDSGLTAAFNRSTGAVQQLAPAMQKAGAQGNVVFTALRKQQEQARDATQVLGYALGIQLPRELEKVLAKSKLLGPALAGAFNIAIFAGFGAAVLSQIPKIAAFSLAIGGMTAEFKALEEGAQRASNVALMGFATPQQGAAIQRSIMKQIEDLRSLADFSALDIFVGTPARRAIDYWFGTDDERAKKLEALTTLSGEIAKRGKELREQELAHAKQTGEKRLAHEKSIAEGIIKLWEMQTDARLDAIQKSQEAAAKLALGVETAVDHAFDLLEQRRAEGLQFTERLATDRFNVTASAEDKIRAEYVSTFQQLGNLEASGMITHAEFEAGKVNASAIGAARMMEIQQHQMQEWQMAVHQMSGVIERFLDNPVQYLKGLWKRFVANMVAEWILAQRAMQAVTGGGGAAQGGFSIGGILSSLFGIGGGSRSASTSGASGMSTTFPTSGGGFNFSSLTNPSAVQMGRGISGSLGALLPMSAGGGMLATGATVSTTAKLSLGAQLAAIAPMLGLGAGLAGGALLPGLLGFGNPTGAKIGAGAGALLGTFLFPGIGTIIGALFGGLLGSLFGTSTRDKKKRQAQTILDQGRAEWRKIISDFEAHRIDYGSAVAGVTQVWQQMVQAWSSPSLGKYGGIAIRNNEPEFRRTMQQLDDLQAKRQWGAQSPMFNSAGEFSTGGFVGAASSAPTSGFGPLGIPIMPRGLGKMPSFASGGAVQITAHAGEFVMQRSAVQRIGRRNLEAINRGSVAGAGPMIQIIAWDGESVDRWLRNGGTEKLDRVLQRAARDRGES